MHEWAIIAAASTIIVNAGVIFTALWRIHVLGVHLERVVDYFALEHEVLMQDYADRHKLKLDDLPTRLKKAPWWPKKS